MQNDNSNYTDDYIDNVELLCKDIIALCKTSINQANHSFLNTSNLNVNLKRLNEIIKNNININLLEKITIFFANIEKEIEIDLNRCLYMNMNLLCYAIKYSYFKVAKVLIKAGVDVNAKDTNGNRPLHIATLPLNIMIVNHIDDELLENHQIIKLLIDKGARINVYNKEGITPLHNLCQRGDFKMIKFLEKNEANFDVYDFRGNNLLFYSVLSDGELKVIQYLIQKKNIDVNSSNQKMQNVLFHLIKSYKLFRSDIIIKIIKYLVKKGIDLNAYDNNGNTSLFYAIQQGHLEIIIFLIEEAGAFVNFSNKQGKTPLFYAVQTNNIAIVEYLITKKANVSVCDQKGETALFDAVRQENIEIIRLLILQDSTNINIFNNKQQNLLCIANIQSNPIIINFLSELIINIDSCNNQENNIESKKLLTMYNNQGSISVPLELTKQITTNSAQLDQDIATTNPKLNLK